MWWRTRDFSYLVIKDLNIEWFTKPQFSMENLAANSGSRFHIHNDSIEMLKNAEKGRNILQAISFEKLPREIVNNSTIVERKAIDKCTAIKEHLNKWIEILTTLLNPIENLTVDEQLLGFRRKCSFRQYMSSKPVDVDLI